MHIYVILLEKFDSLHKGCYENGLGTDSLGRWITLGHFDVMRAYELNWNGNLFETINQNNQNRIMGDTLHCHSHPLFLLSTEEEDLVWKSRKNSYIAVARIHFSRSIQANNSYDQLARNLKNLVENLKQKHLEWDCEYQLFRTIELSDMIFVVRSEWMKHILAFTLTIQQYSDVGKVYTYCGISWDNVQNHAWMPKQTDYIPLLSMRFSVADYYDAKKMVEQVEQILGQGQAYSVVGVDDIVVNCKDLPVKNLVELYRNWFLDGSIPDNSDSFCLEKAFAEITTRAGILLETVVNSENDEGDPNNLKKLCQQLSDQLTALQFKLVNSHPAMIRPILELTAVLMRMSRTPLLDEFVYLMLPAVKSFLENMNGRFRELSDKDIVRCNSFIEYWESLFENVMRIEGQLTHHPDMRPVLYDIPVAMLEYTLAFLDQTAELLQSGDEKKSSICFLLKPCLDKRIKAEELFPAEPGVSRSGLVLLSIPYQLFYKPNEVQRALCHEVSHFVGEAQRLRNFRREKYIQSAAVLIARVLFNSNDSSYLDAIQKCLIAETAYLENFRIRNMYFSVLNWLDRILETEDNYFDFIRSVIQSAETGKCPRISMGNIEQIRLKKKDCADYLLDIGNLYRESYADICMLFLLPIQGEDYVESLIVDLNDSTENDEDLPNEWFATRIYISLKSVGRKIPIQTIRNKSELVYKKIEYLSSLMDAREDSIDREIPATSVFHILKYMEKCFQSLNENISDSSKNRIVKMFQNVTSSQMDYKTFLEAIDDYRKKVLNH